ncbi:hypothetical protein MCC02034_16980 [Bifidobacteriaceae bacterium MCC02034]|nr:hypothetical protein MCC02034_16980 [Bifidobacteriaceae bacterium MCC02034]
MSGTLAGGVLQRARLMTKPSSRWENKKRQLNDSIRRKQAAKQLSEGAKVKKALM